ncbi:MAG: terminase gpA endonuclease subunit [Pseudomonadota bacterium]
MTSQLDSRLTKLVNQTLVEVLRPPPDRDACEWAESHRRMPSDSAIPGPFNSSHTPWVKPIMRAVKSGHYRRLVAVFGSQMGKTDAIQLNLMGHCAMDRRMPQLFVAPTRPSVSYISTKRFDKLLELCPELWSGVAKGKRLTVTDKSIFGVPISFAWGGSSVELSSKPIFFVYVDEVDQMSSIKGQGHPVYIVEARMDSYLRAGAMSFLTSTPTLGVVKREKHPDTGVEHWAESDDMDSLIWSLWQQGTAHEWAWNCPDCYECFIPWSGLLQYPEDSRPYEAKQLAFVACPHCGSEIYDHQKKALNDAANYIAPGQILERGEVVGPEPLNDVFSVWTSGLCSNFVTFGERAAKMREAELTTDDGVIQPAFNTSFGESYSQKGKTAKWEDIAALQLPYKFMTWPDESAHTLLAGVDVQEDHLVVSIRAWGPELESWQVFSGTIYATTGIDKPAVWARLGQLLDTPIAGRYIKLMAVDYNYAPSKHMILEFARRRQDRVIACIGRGSSQMSGPFTVSKGDRKPDGTVIKRGIKVIYWDADMMKSWLYSRYYWPPGEAGGFHLSHDTDEEYCKQLCAEKFVEDEKKWVKTRKNDYLDCEAMMVMLTKFLKLDWIGGDYMDMPDEESPASTDETVPAPEPVIEKPAAPMSRPRTRGLTNRPRDL